MSDNFPEPSPLDQHDFLLLLYFGAEGDDVARAVRRAYQDLSRTVYRVGSCPEARPLAQEVLRSELAALPSRDDVTNQGTFDAWHEDVCRKLSAAFATAGYTSFRVGQAQKWLNMALKYIYVFGETRLPGYARFYRFCHVPIDNIVLNSPRFYGLAHFAEAWSRITEYSKYLAFQVAVRERFPHSPPLAVEFRVWQQEYASNNPGHLQLTQRRPSPESLPKPSEDLIRDFIRQERVGNSIRLSVCQILWKGSHEPRSHWRQVMTLPAETDAAAMIKAIDAILHDGRYFGVCKECNERLPAGWMLSNRLCHRCASTNHGVVF